MLTGFLDVGGGFLVVPALLLVVGLPMQYAAGTSLVVITLTSAVALAVRAGSGLHPDWAVVLLLTAVSARAGLVGARVAARIAPTHPGSPRLSRWWSWPSPCTPPSALPRARLSAPHSWARTPTAESIEQDFTERSTTTCRATRCRTCGKTTWAGCGQHVDQVMAHIPQADHCPGHPEAVKPARSSFLLSIFR